MKNIKHNKEQDFLKYKEIYSVIHESFEEDCLDVKSLDDLIKERNHSKEFVENITSEEKFVENCNILEEAYVSRDLKGFNRRINALNRADKIKKRLYMASVSVAAAVAALSMYIFVANEPHSEDSAIAEAKPTLLSDHKVIVLDNDRLVVGEKIYDKNGNLILNNDISKVGDNNNSVDNKSIVDSVVNSMNKLMIPAKMIYSVKLSDGTEVILNAGSSISYPNAFNGETREVSITGEVYFDVAKCENKPFIVKAKGVDIRVYGTQFNVNANKMGTVETTLINGSVSVSMENKDSVNSVKLKPGYQSIVDVAIKKSDVIAVDVNKYISWMKGVFYYENANLKVVLDEMSNWYDIKFEYDNREIENIKITLEIDRNTEIEEIIKALEKLLEMKITNKKGGVYFMY